MVSVQPERVRPPAGLERKTAALFEQIVSTCNPRHFVESDVPLLVEYVQAVTLARRAARELRNPVVAGKPSAWLMVQEKSVRAMTALALRLRICPQSREHPRTTGRHAHGPRPSPLDRFLEDYPDE